MTRLVMKMKRFPLLIISRTLLVARKRRRIIIQTTTSKSSPVPLLLRGKPGVRTVQLGKLGVTASARDLQSRLVLLVRRGLIRTKCNLCIVLQAVKDPHWAIIAVSIMNTISTTIRTILQFKIACPKWWRNTHSDTPTPIISILTSIIITHLAQSRSIQMTFKAMGRQMQKGFVTITSTSSVPLIEPPLPRTRRDSCGIDNTAVQQIHCTSEQPLYLFNGIRPAKRAR